MLDIIKEFLALREKQPRAALYQIVNQNSQFTNYTDGLKNCYILSNAYRCEDTYYGRDLFFNRDCIDCDHCKSCELCYECVDCFRCYNGRYLQDCEDCIDCTLGYDLRGCRNCFGCVSLRQKEFFYFNEPFSKENYFEKIRNLKNSPYSMQQFENLKKNIPRRFAHIRQSEAVTGDYILNSKQCFSCFDLQESQDCGYCYEVKNSTDCLDITVGEFMVGNYECQSAWKLQNSVFCNNCWESSDLEYCDQVFRSHQCFFCVYLNHKEFYILNKPYSKEEYFKQVAVYKDQLKADGLYGRWFIRSAYPIEDTCATMEYM